MMTVNPLKSFGVPKGVCPKGKLTSEKSYLIEITFELKAVAYDAIRAKEFDLTLDPMLVVS